MSLETIKKRIKIIHDLQERLRNIKDTSTGMIQDLLDVQEVESKYLSAKEEYDEKIKAVKGKPQIANALQEMKETKEEIKENKEIVSQELVEYYKETGSMEITDIDGTVYKVSFAAKLKAE